MVRQKTHKFGSKVYILAGFAASRRMANIKARNLRDEGWLVRVTSSGKRPVVYEVWSRLPRR